MFLNLKDSQVTINSYRFPDATATTQDDLVSCIDTNQCLTAIVDNVDTLPNWIQDMVYECEEE